MQMTDTTQIIINAILLGVIGLLTWRITVLERESSAHCKIIHKLIITSSALIRGQQDGKIYCELEETAK